ALAGGVNAPGNPIDYTVAGNFPIVINVPSRDGYVFSHWMVACANGTSLVLPVSGIPDGTTGVITLTAVWVPNTTEEFTVTYNGNEYTNGNIPVDDANPYTAGSTVIVLDANTMIKSNFTFLGWALTSTATTATYQAGDTFDITQDTTLYAVWQENSKYTVTYNGNNNTGGNIPNDSNSPYYTDSTVTLLSNTGNLVRSGYTFLGWATTSSATAPTYTVSGSTISPSTFTIGSTNVVLYAVWKQDATPSPRPSSSGSSSSTQNTPTTSTTPTTDPDKNSTPNTSSDLVIEEDEPTIEWAVLNLVFGVVGFVLAVLFVVVLLLQKIKDDKKGSKDPFDIDGGLWRNNIGWLAVMLILGIAGLVMFILTENTTGNMIWIDSWTLISGTIFISEIIIIPIIFKNK
ncbi:MAG: InlB B-repeat-containing protein, partial [Candidatus Bathyarchaeota archaeon]|nr:InlB B-repeat-containing protein [Candidatus Termiticorpusculum sp.]